MRKTIIITLLLVCMSNVVMAINIDNHTTITVDNVKYHFKTPTVLSDLYINNSYVLFNGSIKFKINSNTTDITFVNLSNYRSFTVYNPNHNAQVNFYIGGFTPNRKYNIKVDGVSYTTVTANSTGFIYFNYTGWSEHDFDITSSVQLLKVDATRNIINPLNTLSTIVQILGTVIIIGLILMIVAKMRGVI